MLLKENFWTSRFHRHRFHRAFLLKIDLRKARERESATFDENRRTVGMLNPMRDKNERTYRGGKETTYVTTACSQDR